ncbi:MAG: hypothetical protein JNG82_15230 [Opitutaceae bacterium]|nr:hypothetical protein [Opitutaceae bacterium]
MNGRVYDPVLGRFISADPNVDGVEDAQGYNHYSYVGNNPLGATDPTGFFKLKDALKIVAVVAAGVLTAGAAVWAGAAMGGLSVGYGVSLTAVLTPSAFTLGGATFVGATAGFGSGFAGSVLNGGSLGDAFKSGVIGAGIGAITGGIANKLGIGRIPNDAGQYYKQLAAVSAMGGVGGGLSAELQGGQFRHGFRTGAIYGAAGYVAFTGLNTYLNEEGIPLKPDGGPEHFGDYDRVTTNGIMGDRAGMQAKINAASSGIGAGPTPPCASNTWIGFVLATTQLAPSRTAPTGCGILPIG